MLIRIVSLLSFLIQIMPCVPFLAKLLFDEDKEILSNSLWSVAFLGMYVGEI